MSSERRQALARAALEELDRFDEINPDMGPQTMARILQPMFVLSGYRLRDKLTVQAGAHFHLIGENLLNGGDCVLVNLGITRGCQPRGAIPGAVYDYVLELPPQNPTRIIFIGNAGFNSHIRQIYNRALGPRLELWSFEDVRQRFGGMLLEPDERDDVLIQIMGDFLDKLAIGIAEATLNLRRIEWRDLERLIAHVFQELGYGVALTSASHDGGRDVIVADLNTAELGVFNIEIKHWTLQPVGEREVRRLLEVSLREQREGALMLATSGVSHPGLAARTESMMNYLRFGDEEKIVLTCRSFARKRAGLWTQPRPFQSYLLEGTI